MMCDNDSFSHYLLPWNLFAETYPFRLVHRAIPGLLLLSCEETGYDVSLLNAQNVRKSRFCHR